MFSSIIKKYLSYLITIPIILMTAQNIRLEKAHYISSKEHLKKSFFLLISVILISVSVLQIIQNDKSMQFTLLKIFNTRNQ